MRSLLDFSGAGQIDEYVNVVLFAGGGGADQGMERAGLPVHIAINHDPEAIAMHKANFPNCEHHINDVWSVSPRWAVRHPKTKKIRKVGCLWASPDCTHHSRAKGGKPRSQKIRDLAWIVEKWARETSPNIIFLENVEEFQSWCDLIQKRDKDGNLVYTVDGKKFMVPDKRKIDKNGYGNLFKVWRNAIKKLGYKIEFKLMRACDYGAPTIRKRFFMVARRDGVKIQWPEPTHGASDSPEVLSGKLLPFRTAAECIEWEEACGSIFERKKDLAENTLRRVALGVKKFVQEAERPFIVNLTHGGRVEDLANPMYTITGANRGEKALCTPHIVTNTTGHAGASANSPLATVTTGNHHFLTSPYIVKSNHTASYYHCFRGQSLEAPLQAITKVPGFSLAMPFLTKYCQNSIGHSMNEQFHTITAGGKSKRPGTGNVFGLTSAALTPTSPVVEERESVDEIVAACILKHYTGVVGISTDSPLGSITSKDHHSHLVAHLTRFNGRSVGSSADTPAPSVMGRAHDGLVSACLVREMGQSNGAAIDEPAPTVMPGGMGKTRVAAAHITKMRGTNTAYAATGPVHTISAGGTHHALTETQLTPARLQAAHTVKYYGTNYGQDLNTPTHTVTTKARHGLSMLDLIQYNGCSQAHPVDAPLNTITRKERFGLVESKTEGGHFEKVKELLSRFRRKKAWGFQADEFDEVLLDAFEAEVVIGGEVYRIEDIGMRMLMPRELYRAQGFEDSFDITPKYNGKALTKTAQVRMCGNSVPPAFAEALVHANKAYDVIPEPLAA